jgi:hypothetical protein
VRAKGRSEQARGVDRHMVAYPLRPSRTHAKRIPRSCTTTSASCTTSAQAYAQFTGGKPYPVASKPKASVTDPQVLHDHISALHEELTEAYTLLSGKAHHTRECPISQGYVYRPGPCNCDAPPTPLR